jgi:hypothetical protein
MNVKRRIAGVSMLLASGLLASFAVFGTASATWEEPDGGGAASTDSSVATDLWCTWYATGFLSTITLAGAEGAEYEGEAFELTGEDADQAALVSGYVAEAAPTVGEGQEDCSWYNAEKGLTVTITGTGAGFTSRTEAESDDNSLGWDLANSPLAVTFTPDPEDACSEDWILEDGLTIDSNLDSVDAATIAWAADMSTSESCQWDTTFSTAIPANLTPANPGSTYTFVGPTLTTSLEFNSAPE